MRRRTIRTGRGGEICLSALGLGGGPLGNLYKAISDETAESTLSSAWAEGIRYFDTAPFYGLGLSEQRMGAFLRSKPREDFVLSTKVGRLLHSAPAASERYGFVEPLANDFSYDYGYDGVMVSIESSLKRLGLDRIDIVLMHDLGVDTHGPEHQFHFEQAMAGGYRRLDELRSQGVIGAIGLGVNETSVCCQAMELGRWNCFLLAGRYSLLEQSALDDFFPQCRAHGAKVICGGVFNSGILATGTQTAKRPSYNYAPAPDAILEKVRKLEAVCRHFEVPLAAAALQFPACHPDIVNILVGASEAARLRQCLVQFATSIPTEFWSQLKDEGLLDKSAPTPEPAQLTEVGMQGPEARDANAGAEQE